MRQPLALKKFDMLHHQGSCANQRANLSLDALIGRLPAYKLRDLLPGRTLTCCPRAERQRKMINLAPSRTAHRKPKKLWVVAVVQIGGSFQMGC
jgi:hypothetical protein